MSATENERSLAIGRFVGDFDRTLDQESVGNGVQRAVKASIKEGGFIYRIEFNEDKSAWLFFEARPRLQRMWFEGSRSSPEIFLKRNFFDPVVIVVNGSGHNVPPEDWSEFSPLRLKKDSID